MLVDLNWGPTIVPSSSCEYWCIDRHQFNSSHSCTYRDMQKRDSLHYRPALGTFQGNWSMDVAHFGSFILPDVQFVEFDRIDGIFTYYQGYDGVLGFAAFDPKIPNKPWNPIRVLVAERLLDRNLFALLLPANGADGNSTDGELHLGAVPESYTDSDRFFVTVPINPRSYKVDAWLGNMAFISYQYGYEQFNNSFIAFSLVDLPLLLPTEHANMINAAINAHAGTPVDCNKRSIFPNITLDVGGSEPLVLTGFDYVYMDGGKGCKSMVSTIDNLEEERFRNVTVFFGSVALQRWMTVFDLDEKEIRLTTRDHDP
ncbi:acid protease [Microthyrium microscopicum]|uniref:Acid protease n=1 Tax=Microthyrium microscopicum TaxID=703497 RepID=A0A6A6UTT4_9PEZI|nr:acid protease [Microthyrium microscopicum]